MNQTTERGIPRKPNAAVTALTYLGMIVLIAAGWWFIWWGSRATVESQIIRDARRQWAIVAKGDDAMAKSVHAGALAQAYLMAGKEKEYNEWKAVADRWQRIAFGGGQ